MVMMWSAPATDNMLATNFAEIGARLWKNNDLHYLIIPFLFVILVTFCGIISNLLQ